MGEMVAGHAWGAGEGSGIVFGVGKVTLEWEMSATCGDRLTTSERESLGAAGDELSIGGGGRDITRRRGRRRRGGT